MSAPMALPLGMVPKKYSDVQDPEEVEPPQVVRSSEMYCEDVRRVKRSSRPLLTTSSTHQPMMPFTYPSIQGDGFPAIANYGGKIWKPPAGLRAKKIPIAIYQLIH